MTTLATLGIVVVSSDGLIDLAIVLPTIGLSIEGIALLARINCFLKCSVLY